MLIQQLKLGTLLPNGTDTAIIAYADDLLIISSNLKHLQIILDHCVKYAYDHNTIFNHAKTQFVISGKSPIQDPYLTLNGIRIKPQNELKHLGFTWKLNKSKKLSLQSHVDSRLAELWSVATSLISAGIRKLHPNSIVSLFETIVIPKLLYGLEIISMPKSLTERINRQARTCLKSLFGISKKSKNYIHRMYNIKEVSTYLEKRGFALIEQLFRNKTTANYILGLLTQADRSYSTLNSILQSCNRFNVDVIE